MDALRPIKRQQLSGRLAIRPPVGGPRLYLNPGVSSSDHSQLDGRSGAVASLACVIDPPGGFKPRQPMGYNPNGERQRQRHSSDGQAAIVLFCDPGSAKTDDNHGHQRQRTGSNPNDPPRHLSTPG